MLKCSKEFYLTPVHMAVNTLESHFINQIPHMLNWIHLRKCTSHFKFPASMQHTLCRLFTSCTFDQKAVSIWFQFHWMMQENNIWPSWCARCHQDSPAVYVSACCHDMERIPATTSHNTPTHNESCTAWREIWHRLDALPAAHLTLTKHQWCN